MAKRFNLGRRRFRVSLRRKGTEPKTIFTVAASPSQARRFVVIRNPGYSITRVRPD